MTHPPSFTLSLLHGTLPSEGEAIVLFVLVWLTFLLSARLTFHKDFSKIKVKSDHTSA